nr:hypothetical protein [Microbacterium sp. Se63.02b]
MLRRRLAQAGVALDPAAFRGRQLGWVVAGIGAGAAVLVVLAVIGRLTLPTSGLPLLCGALAAVSYDMQLSARQVPPHQTH